LARQVDTTTLDAEGQGRVLLLAGNITPTLEEALHVTSGDASNVGVMATGVLQDIDGEPRLDRPNLGADEYWPPGALRLAYLPLIIMNQ